MAIMRSGVNRAYQPDEIILVKIDPIGRKLGSMFTESKKHIKTIGGTFPLLTVCLG